MNNNRSAHLDVQRIIASLVDESDLAAQEREHLKVCPICSASRRHLAAQLHGLSEEEKEQDHPDMGPNSYDQLVGKQFWTRFNEFIKKLPGVQQQVFRLRFLDHLSIAEIALTLEKNESSVKTHLYRAIEKFKNEGFSLGSTP